MKYVLDSSAIFTNPEILSSAKSRSLAIPQSVFMELLDFGSQDEAGFLKSLLNDSISSGAKVVAALDQDATLVASGNQTYRSLSPVEQETAAIALHFADEGPVTVVTLAKRLEVFLESTDIPFITPQEFLRDTPYEAKNNAIYFEATNLKRVQLRRLVLAIVGGLVGTTAFGFVVQNAAVLADVLQFWGFLVALFIVGILLYWIRQHYRKTYGFAEFGIGLFVSYLFLSTMDKSGLNVSNGVQLVGGLYVMVRGLDNIGVGLKGRRFAHHWARVFG